MPSKQPQRFLVTGATGYIGHRLCRRLARHGHLIAAVVRCDSRARMLAQSVPGIVLIQYDSSGTSDPERLQSAIADFAPDILCHLAALTLPGHGPETARALVAANLGFAAETLAAAVAAGCRCVVDTGTFWQHGDGTDAYDPATLYAATKQAFQDLLAYYVRAVPSLRAVTLKLFQVYGPGDPRGRILDLLLEAQAKGSPLALSPGDQELDLVHVDDVVEAYCAAAAQLARDPSPLPRADYAVATGRVLTLRQVVALIERVTGAPVPVRWGARPYREGEVMHSWGGPLLPGWRAGIALEEGLAELASISHHRSYHDAPWSCAR